MAPPSEDVPESLALSNANHAVSVANDLLQFRENLAPDDGGTMGQSCRLCQIF